MWFLHFVLDLFCLLMLLFVGLRTLLGFWIWCVDYLITFAFTIICFVLGDLFCAFSYGCCCFDLLVLLLLIWVVGFFVYFVLNCVWFELCLVFSWVCFWFCRFGLTIYFSCLFLYFVILGGRVRLVSLLDGLFVVQVGWMLLITCVLGFKCFWFTLVIYDHLFILFVLLTCVFVFAFFLVLCSANTLTWCLGDIQIWFVCVYLFCCSWVCVSWFVCVEFVLFLILTFEIVVFEFYDLLLIWLYLCFYFVVLWFHLRVCFYFWLFVRLIVGYVIYYALIDIVD